VRSRTQAAAYAWAARGKPGPSSRRPAVADEHERALADAERAAALLPTVGFCSWCGDVVDEAEGRLHAPDCGVAAERRRPSDDRVDFGEEWSRG
jgi:hypothetical protein